MHPNDTLRPSFQQIAEAAAFAREQIVEAEKREPLTLDELKAHMRHLATNPGDRELVHVAVDKFLLRYIGDDDVRELHEALAAWYA